MQDQKPGTNIVTAAKVAYQEEVQKHKQRMKQDRESLKQDALRQLERMGIPEDLVAFDQKEDRIYAFLCDEGGNTLTLLVAPNRHGGCDLHLMGKHPETGERVPSQSIHSLPRLGEMVEDFTPAYDHQLRDLGFLEEEASDAQNALNSRQPAHPTNLDTNFTGLTKREAAAMAAMQGLLAGMGFNFVTPDNFWEPDGPYNEVAEMAVEQADRLLDALSDE